MSLSSNVPIHCDIAVEARRRGSDWGVLRSLLRQKLLVVRAGGGVNVAGVPGEVGVQVIGGKTQFRIWLTLGRDRRTRETRGGREYWTDLLSILKMIYSGYRK